MLDLLITNATIVTVDPQRNVLHNAYIGIQDESIAAIGKMETLAQQSVKTIDASNCAVFPGFINTHTHSYQSLIKSIATDKPLNEWLAQAAFPAAGALTPAYAECAASITALENIHSGVTTLVDMCPKADVQIYKAIRSSFDKIGVEGIIAIGFTHDPSDGPMKLEETLQGIENIIREAQAEGRANSVMLAPFQVWNNSSQSLKMTRNLVEEHGIRLTIHVLETVFDNDSTISRFGMREIETLDAYGLLGDKTLLVHCVQMLPEDFETILSTKTHVSVSPVCNLYLASGIPPVSEMASRGISHCLSTEGAGCNNSNDMIESMKTLAISQKARYLKADAYTAEQVLEASTISAARAIGRERFIGSIEVGKKADLVIFDPLESCKAVPTFDPVQTLVYSSSEKNVRTVIKDGRIVLEDGKVKGVCERAFLGEAQQTSNMFLSDAKIKRL